MAKTHRGKGIRHLYIDPTEIPMKANIITVVVPAQLVGVPVSKYCLIIA